ncbi:hypothetical protein GOP47_0026346 [Adiantum capillus-veneris]|nr:hypothetical protein GOP47_0026346 [Adiantum capillus-veneris]
MGTCLGTQAKVESSFHGGSGDPSAASSPKKIKSPSGETTSNYDVPKAASRELSQPPSSSKVASLRAFSFTDLKSCTRNFKPDTLLGEGGFGRVFKGHIDEQTFLPTRAGQGMTIAVKKLNLDGHQGHKEWLAEVHFLGTLHHPNLVKLIGFCAEDDHRLLVYEFMSRGSLENHLFRKNNHYQPLSWATRLKIAIGAARGLTFLHDAQRPVIYRDFKASNILLDSQYNAKLSDFGLAKDGPTGDNTHVSTRVMGTLGYAAPEYVATGHLTAKSDVYSFGVVLLEILTGFKAVDKTRPVDEQNLVDWARPYLNDRNKTLLIMDKRLQGEYSPRGAQKAAHIAHCCLNPEAKGPSGEHITRSFIFLVSLLLDNQNARKSYFCLLW